ncbi:MAG TPA: hypothetical protein VJU14_08555 [Solirubrobacterales bacterium]|nr:hypothetical protein [Solirubrobacterales bacterium]
MRSLKKVGTLIVVVFALGAANASAAEFTASATGELSAKALSIQAWTFTGHSSIPNKQYKCTTTTAQGKIEKTALTSLHMTMFYNLCTIFGFVTPGSTGFTFVFHANGTVDITNKIAIPASGAACSIVIEPQSALGSVTWDNNSGKLVQTINLSGVTYTSTGFLCGPSGTNGSYTGTNEISRVGGGSLSFDP